MVRFVPFYAVLAAATLCAWTTVARGDDVCVAVPEGLVSWWPGDGDTNDLRELNDGTRTGNLTFTDPGRVGPAFAFDGASEVVVAPDESLNVTELTIDAWVFPTARDGLTEMIINKEIELPDGNRDIQWELGVRGERAPTTGNIPTGNLAFFLGHLRGRPDDYAGWTDANAAVPLLEWTHVAVTFDGSAAVAYVNGEATRTLTELSGTLATTDGPLKIGSRGDQLISNFPDERFDGLIDEVDVFDRALSAAEIRAIYEAGAAGKCKPGACDADCNQDGVVTINELITAVSIALGLQPPAACPPADADGNGEVAVNELVAAVNRALFGC